MKQKIIIICLSALIAVGTGHAQTSVDELRDEVSEQQKKLEQLNTEIQNLQREITRKQKQTASLKNEISLFDLQIKQTEIQILEVEQEIQQVSADILEAQIAIQEKNEEIDKQKSFLGETLRLINEYDHVSPLETVLGNNTFSELLDQAQYTTNLQEKTQTVLNAVKILKIELEQKKQVLEANLNEHESLKNQLQVAHSSLEEQRGNKQSLLSRTRGQERIYQALLGEAAKKQEEVEREIYELEVTIRQRLGDKTLPPIAGLLSWPMSGVLTQGYGNTGFHALGYTFHNGIDVAAPAGTKVYAAGDGLVYATGTGKAAYGNWVVIKHALSKEGKVYNIYTLYGHLQSFVLSTGEIVRRGDLLGFEGNTGNTTRLLYGPERGYHLHFTIFDEDGFDIRPGAYQSIHGAYQIPYGYTYNPLHFLQ